MPPRLWMPGTRLTSNGSTARSTSPCVGAEVLAKAESLIRTWGRAPVEASGISWSRLGNISEVRRTRLGRTISARFVIAIGTREGKGSCEERLRSRVQGQNCWQSKRWTMSWMPSIGPPALHAEVGTPLPAGPSSGTGAVVTASGWRVGPGALSKQATTTCRLSTAVCNCAKGRPNSPGEMRPAPDRSSDERERSLQIRQISYSNCGTLGSSLGVSQNRSIRLGKFTGLNKVQKGAMRRGRNVNTVLEELPMMLDAESSPAQARMTKT